jgi:prepilin-type processing-associated H-X9-DG protein
MPIPFTCPHCGTQTNVDEQYAGQSGPCAACGKTITVPSSAGTPFSSGAPGRSSAGPVIALIVVGALVAMLVCGGVMALFFVRAGNFNVAFSGQAECSNNLRQIGLAMHNYHNTYKCFPAAVLTDENDRPMHSWRVAILPYLEEAPLYDLYDFNEPWNGPNNGRLLGSTSMVYRCPDDGVSMMLETSYVMIVGKGTLGGLPNEEVRIADILDGMSDRIMVIEVGSTGIPWMEPRDITVEEAVTFVTDPAASQFQQVHPGGVNVLFADGSVRCLPNSIDPQMLRAMLTVDDGQAVSVDF